MTRFDPEILALRSVLNGAIAQVPQFSRSLAGQVSAVDTFYAPQSPDTHTLVGSRAPNLRFSHGIDLFGLLAPARYVMLDLAGCGLLGDLPAQEASSHGPVVHSGTPVERRTAWDKVRAALVRPDGHVAWASEEADDSVLHSDAAAALSATRCGTTPQGSAWRRCHQHRARTSHYRRQEATLHSL